MIKKIFSVRFQAAFLYILSLTLHLIYLLELRSSPLFDYPVLDMYWHREWAVEILSGDFWGEEVFFRAPLYPYFLAALMWIAGKGYFWPRVMQAVVGSFTPMLVYLLCFRLIDNNGDKTRARRWSLYAGIITAFYPLLIMFDVKFLIPVLIVPLDVLLVLSLLKLKDAAPGLRWAVPGVIMGASALARPTILTFGAGIIIWLFMVQGSKQWKAALGRAGVLFLFCLIVIMPVTVRNYIKGGEFVLISSQGGINFWIGNNPNSKGKEAISPGFGISYGGYKDSVWVSSEKQAEEELGRELSQSEVSKYWYKKGMAFVLERPADSLSLFAKKFYFLLNGTEIPSNQSIYFFINESMLLKILLWPGPVKFPYGILMPLAVAGMFLVRRRWREYSLLYLFVFIYGITIIAFFVNARFRLPLLPFLIVFAVSGAKTFIEAAKERKWKDILAGVFIFAAMFAVSNSSLFDVEKEDVSEPFITMGSSYYEKGELEKAKEMFRLAYELNPVEAINNHAMGMAYFLDKDYRNALEYYKRAAFIEPMHPEIHFNIGLTYESMGRYKEAEQYYSEALRLWPKHKNALNRLIYLRNKNGKPLRDSMEER